MEFLISTAVRQRQIHRIDRHRRLKRGLRKSSSTNYFSNRTWVLDHISAYPIHTRRLLLRPGTFQNLETILCRTTGALHHQKSTNGMLPASSRTRIGSFDFYFKHVCKCSITSYKFKALNVNPSELFV